MTRSSWKVPYVDYKLLNTILNDNEVSIKTNSRQTKILQSFVGLNIFVHTGKVYKRVYISEDMVGKKLGEFAYTRKIGNIHKKKEKKK